MQATAHPGPESQAGFSRCGRRVDGRGVGVVMTEYGQYARAVRRHDRLQLVQLSVQPRHPGFCCLSSLDPLTGTALLHVLRPVYAVALLHHPDELTLSFVSSTASGMA